MPADEDVRDGASRELRVLANADGSEVVFTLYERPGMSDEVFAADARAVAADLAELKRLVEAGARGE